ncbi:MAG: glycosyltransferase family 2 protein [Deltaproteobacteria bacterium]|nr:glycosyltransferase family 2 protein [Deltaproteobacteria bacterium]
MEQAPVVSIIIANWNGKEVLESCLESLYAMTEKNFEIIIVDNGSRDGSVEMIKSHFSQAIIIENKKNLGFAKANNQGIKASKGEFILTLNNDTLVEVDFLDALLLTVKGGSEDVGMWAPKILSVVEKDIIDSVGGLLIYPDGLARGRGRLEKDQGQFDEDVEILMPSACAGLYRKKMLDVIGLFDPDFFAYCEDTDLGLRAKLAGWRAFSVPKARVFHHYSKTSGAYNLRKAYLIERNRVWVVLKNFPLKNLLLSPAYTFSRYLTHLYGIKTGKGASARYSEQFSMLSLCGILLRAYGAAFYKLLPILKKRKKIKEKKLISNLKFSKLLFRFGMSAKEIGLKD